jgi:hypothetical protein
MHAGTIQRTPWLGIALIIVGSLLLLDRAHVIHVYAWGVVWPVLMLAGAMGVIRGFSAARHGKIFWGTVLFLYSLFFFLKSIDVFDIEAAMFVPASFFAFGSAFLMLFVNDFRQWPFLIPGSIFIAIGALIILAEYDYMSFWDVRDLLHTYWPLILIVLGLTTLLRRRTPRTEAPPPPPSPV